VAAGADDFWPVRASSGTVAEAIGDCAFIAGTTRAAFYYWDSRHRATSPAASWRCRGESRGAAVRFGRLRLATEDLNHCNVLVRIPAHPEVLLAESGHVGAAWPNEILCSRADRIRIPS